MSASEPSLPAKYTESVIKLTEKPSCAVCQKTENLSRCGNCKSVSYCSRDHQRAHWPDHKKACKHCRLCFDYFAEQEDILKAVWTPYGTFSIDRRYFLAYRLIADALVDLETCEATEKALDWALRLIKLNRWDHHGANFVIPALFLRLGRVQECYDFIKWWSNDGPRHYEDPTVYKDPFFATRGADAFESVGDCLIMSNLMSTPFPNTMATRGLARLTGKTNNLAHTLTLLFLKMQLWIDLINLQSANESLAVEKLPKEIMDMVRRHTVSSYVASRRDVIDREDHDEAIVGLENQIYHLTCRITKINEDIWEDLLEKPITNMSWTTANDMRLLSGLSVSEKNRLWTMASISRYCTEHPEVAELLRGRFFPDGKSPAWVA